MASDPSDKDKPNDEAGARRKENAERDNDALKRSRPEKIREGEGNLRRRADWFQKRTGGN
jgi:hypothetical protein